MTLHDGPQRTQVKWLEEERGGEASRTSRIAQDRVFCTIAAENRSFRPSALNPRSALGPRNGGLRAADRRRLRPRQNRNAGSETHLRQHPTPRCLTPRSRSGRSPGSGQRRKHMQNPEHRAVQILTISSSFSGSRNATRYESGVSTDELQPRRSRARENAARRSLSSPSRVTSSDTSTHMRVPIRNATQPHASLMRRKATMQRPCRRLGKRDLGAPAASAGQVWQRSGICMRGRVCPVVWLSGVWWFGESWNNTRSGIPRSSIRPPSRSSAPRFRLSSSSIASSRLRG